MLASKGPKFKPVLKLRAFLINSSFEFSAMPFIPGNQYTRNDIYEILDVPLARREGAWNRGLRRYEGQNFIFANVGFTTSTGNSYPNGWAGDHFEWFGLDDSKASNPGILNLLAPGAINHLFFRTAQKAPFTYVGRVSASHVESEAPVRILWNVAGTDYPDEVPETTHTTYPEGATQKVLVNRYERNEQARKDCIKHYGGPVCQICKLDFGQKYGPDAEGFIHVHHLMLLSTVPKGYKVNPQKDLLPVCPNCHAVIHLRNPPYTPAEVREMLA